MSMTPASAKAAVIAHPDMPVPAVASGALAAVLGGAAQWWRVMGATGSGWWLGRGDTALVVTTERTAALPNAVIVPGLRPGIEGRVWVGHGAISGSELGWRVVRWWDPRPSPIPTDPLTLLRRTATARQSPHGDEPAAEVVDTCDAGGVVRAAQRLLGKGPGLTPYGDDLLSGFVSGWRYAASCLGEPQRCAPLDEARPHVLAAARERTTLLSSTLLRHAWCGEVARPVAALLRSLAGRGDPAMALRATTAIGHSSGRALAIGVLAGVAVACEVGG